MSNNVSAENLKRAAILPRTIPTLLIRPNPWNPNEQTDQQKKELSKDINEDGYDQAIIVVGMWGPIPPLPEEVGWKEFDWKKTTHLPPEGKDPNAPDWYRIISGEHRWLVLREQGYQLIDCVVKPSHLWDELQQRIKTVRKNILHGDLNDAKFTALVNELVAQDPVDLEILSAQFGFNRYQDFFRHYEQQQEIQQEEIKNLVEEADKEVSGVDSLTAVINALLTNYQSTLPADFMHFVYRRRVHLMVVMDKECSELMGALVSFLKSQDGAEFAEGVPLTEPKAVISINSFLTSAIRNELERREGEIPKGSRVPRKDGSKGAELHIAPELPEELDPSFLPREINDQDIFGNDDEEVEDEIPDDYIGGEGEEDLEDMVGV